MLTVYRRHNPALCKSSDRYYKRCTCPTWVEGMVGDKYVRHSLKTRSWERAVAKVRKMDATEDPTPRPKATNSFVNSTYAQSRHTAQHGRTGLWPRRRSKNASPASSGSAFVLVG